MHDYGPLGAIPAGELVKQRLQRDVPITNPAAGAEFTIAVPPGITWELLGVHCRIVTSAVVANRVPKVSIKNGDGVERSRFSVNAVLVASTNTLLDWWSGLGDTVNQAGTQQGLPSPALYLPAGFGISSVTSLVDVADQYSEIFLVVREWSLKNVENVMATLFQQRQAQLAGGRVADF